MSGSLAHITQPEAAPPRTGVRRWLSVLLALFLLAAGGSGVLWYFGYLKL